MTSAIYKQYEVGTGTTGQSWSNAQWRPRRDDAWPVVHNIGVNPDACKLVDSAGEGLWIDTQTMPALVKCDFDSLAYNDVVASVNDTRRFVHKYQHQPNANVLKQHCGQMVTVNGKTIPRYLHPSDTFCKSALVGEDYKTFVHDICSNNISAPYCSCVNRNLSADYLDAKGSAADGDASCWYKPCMFNTGFTDPTLTNECTTNMCPLVAPGSDVSICN